MDSYQNYDLDTLARTLYGEARGEGVEGMTAVACVVMNRCALAAQHPHFGNGSPATACQAPYQFSCWNQNDPNRSIILNVTQSDHFFAQAWKIASDIIASYDQDITHGATYYYAEGSPVPDWAKGKTPCVRIGKHIFFTGIA